MILDIRRKIDEILLKWKLNIHFIFKNEVYEQIGGVVVSSAIGLMFNDTFLTKLKSRSLQDVLN